MAGGRSRRTGAQRGWLVGGAGGDLPQPQPEARVESAGDAGTAALCLGAARVVQHLDYWPEEWFPVRRWQPPAQCEFCDQKRLQKQLQYWAIYFEQF